MKTVGRVLLALGLAVIVLVALVLVRTLTFRSAAAVAWLPMAEAPPMDADLAARHLSQAVKFQTVSHQNPAEDQVAAWEAQRAFLETTYPKFHAAAKREVLAGGALLYTWPGTDTTLAPIVLMAHQDVVPVVEETRGLWTADPFGGEIKDGAVWGRGSIDDKGSLIGLMEAAEALAASGFTPKRTIIIASGQDEEVGGTGARTIAETLKGRGVKALFALDEGSALVTDFPLTHKPQALIGIAEKGYATLAITAKGAGGHSSAPPHDTAAVTVARAVVAIADHPFPLKLSGPSQAMLQALAPGLSFTARMAIANQWLFGGLLNAQVGATDVGRSMLHTTIAPTMLSGSPKDNVLPSLATAHVNYRIAPGDTATGVMARATSAVGNAPVTLSFAGVVHDPSPVSSTTSQGFRLVASAAHAMNGAPVAPSLVTAATDGRSMSIITDDVYRFQPISFGLKDIEMIHGVNEHMKISDLNAMAVFYARLMKTAAG